MKQLLFICLFLFSGTCYAIEDKGLTDIYIPIIQPLDSTLVRDLYDYIIGQTTAFSDCPDYWENEYIILNFERIGESKWSTKEVYIGAMDKDSSFIAPMYDIIGCYFYKKYVFIVLGKLAKNYFIDLPQKKYIKIQNHSLEFMRETFDGGISWKSSFTLYQENYMQYAPKGKKLK